MAKVDHKAVGRRPPSCQDFAQPQAWQPQACLVWRPLWVDWWLFWL